MSFKNLNLLPELLRAIDEQGYSEATSIQLQAIPLVLQGSDVLGAAQTGTGKTAGFTLPLLQRLMTSKTKESNQPKKFKQIRALILTPTRELAAQVAESVHTYGKHLPLKADVVFGGVNINTQIKKLQYGTDILIATPGRLLDLVSQKIIDLSHVEILVLDEADRMLDMGFIHDIRRIIALLPKMRQNLLFSATFSEEIKKLSLTILKNPKTVEVERVKGSEELISQVIYPVDNKRKRELLSFLISEGKWSQVLVFTRTKHGANRLCKQLTEDGIAAEAIHGNKSQNARTKALQDFKNGSLRVLVATDIAARGLDIDQLPHVVNFELPNVPEDYVHRIGRTGRAGKEGSSCSLVCVDEDKLLADIEKLLKKKIPQVILEGFKRDPSIKAEPIQKRRQNQSHGKHHFTKEKSHSSPANSHAGHQSGKKKQLTFREVQKDIKSDKKPYYK